MRTSNEPDTILGLQAEVDGMTGLQQSAGGRFVADRMIRQLGIAVTGHPTGRSGRAAWLDLLARVGELADVERDRRAAYDGGPPPLVTAPPVVTVAGRIRATLTPTPPPPGQPPCPHQRQPAQDPT